MAQRRAAPFRSAASDVILGVPEWGTPCVEYSRDTVNSNTKKIVHYDFSWVIAGRYLLMWKDTAFTYHIMLWTALSCAGVSIVGLVICQQEGKSGGPYWGNRNHCLPLDPKDNWLFMTTLVSFLLTIFTSMIFNRWWMMREQTGFVMGRFNNLAMCTSAFVRGEAPGVRTARAMIIRYVQATHELAYAVYRKEEKERLPGLLKEGIITLDEHNFLVTTPNNGWSISLSWIAHTLSVCADKGWLLQSDRMLPFMVGDLQLIRGSINAITGFLTCQIPYPYVQLLVGITKVHIFLVHVYAAALVGPNVWKSGSTGKDKVVLGYCVLVFNCVIYNALLKIAEMLYNPFGDDRPDFPIHAYINNINASTNHLLRVVDSMPTAISTLRHGAEPEPTLAPATAADLQDKKRPSGAGDGLLVRGPNGLQVDATSSSTRLSPWVRDQPAVELVVK